MRSLERHFTSCAFALAMLVGACGRAPDSVVGRAGERRSIVGGSELKPSDPRAAFVVMLRTIVDGRLEICTGTFVSSSAILTAAHCVSNTASATAAIYGLQPFIQEQVVDLPISKIVRHESYHPGARQPNDLALVFFAGGLPPGARVADLHAHDDELGRQPLFVLGYGRTEGSEDSDNALREEGILRGVWMPPELLDVQPDFLIARQDSGRGVCFGDSGGPALKESNGQTSVVAVVSGGGNGARHGVDQCLMPSLFMRVQHFTPWIEKELAANRTP